MGQNFLQKNHGQAHRAVAYTAVGALMLAEVPYVGQVAGVLLMLLGVGLIADLVVNR